MSWEYRPYARRGSRSGDDAIVALVGVGLLLCVGAFVLSAVLLYRAGRVVVRAFRHHPRQPLLWGSLAGLLGFGAFALLALWAAASAPGDGSGSDSTGSPTMSSLSSAAALLGAGCAGLATLALLSLLVTALILEHWFPPTRRAARPEEMAVEEALLYSWWLEREGDRVL